MDEKLIHVFDMINDRLYNMEQKIDILFQLKKEKYNKNFEYPKLMFPSFPFDVVFRDRKPLLLNTPHSCYIYAEVELNKDASLKGIIYEENNPLCDKVINNEIQKDEDRQYIKDAFTLSGNRITNQTNEFFVNSYHRYIQDFIFEKYVQEICPNVWSVYMKGKNNYVFVFENTYKELNGLTNDLKNILETLGGNIEDINRVYVYNIWKHHFLMMFYIHTGDDYSIENLDENTRKTYHKYLSAVRDMRIKCDNKDIMKFTSNPQKLEWFLDSLV
jgi:hypothetical protein